mmetsp:Transcript_37831/g.114273  ORF Transcript_37831/g.114273 Transcript_37831/m.114273 type:complete len:607 (-) Transcript_37831:1004-2824(-)
MLPGLMTSGGPCACNSLSSKRLSKFVSMAKKASSDVAYMDCTSFRKLEKETSPAKAMKAELGKTPSPKRSNVANIASNEGPGRTKRWPHAKSSSSCCVIRPSESASASRKLCEVFGKANEASRRKSKRRRLSIAITRSSSMDTPPLPSKSSAVNTGSTRACGSMSRTPSSRNSSNESIASSLESAAVKTRQSTPNRDASAALMTTTSGSWCNIDNCSNRKAPLWHASKSPKTCGTLALPSASALYVQATNSLASTRPSPDESTSANVGRPGPSMSLMRCRRAGKSKRVAVTKAKCSGRSLPSPAMSRDAKIWSTSVALRTTNESRAKRKNSWPSTSFERSRSACSSARLSPADVGNSPNASKRRALKSMVSFVIGRSWCTDKAGACAKLRMEYKVLALFWVYPKACNIETNSSEDKWRSSSQSARDNNSLPPAGATCRRTTRNPASVVSPANNCWYRCLASNPPLATSAKSNRRDISAGVPQATLAPWSWMPHLVAGNPELMFSRSCRMLAVSPWKKLLRHMRKPTSDALRPRRKGNRGVENKSKSTKLPPYTSKSVWNVSAKLWFTHNGAACRDISARVSLWSASSSAARKAASNVPNSDSTSWR